MSDAAEETSASNAKVGDVVLTENGIGIVRFQGEVPETDKEGVWLGVQLRGLTVDHGTDGTCGEERYFTCPQGTGVFVQNVKRVISPEELLNTIAILNDRLLKSDDSAGQ